MLIIEMMRYEHKKLDGTNLIRLLTWGINLYFKYIFTPSYQYTQLALDTNLNRFPVWITGSRNEEKLKILPAWLLKCYQNDGYSWSQNNRLLFQLQVLSLCWHEQKLYSGGQEMCAVSYKTGL